MHFKQKSIIFVIIVVSNIQIYVTFPAATNGGRCVPWNECILSIYEAKWKEWANNIFFPPADKLLPDYHTFIICTEIVDEVLISW